MENPPPGPLIPAQYLAMWMTIATWRMTMRKSKNCPSPRRGRRASLRGRFWGLVLVPWVFHDLPNALIIVFIYFYLLHCRLTHTLHVYREQVWHRWDLCDNATRLRRFTVGWLVFITARDVGKLTWDVEEFPIPKNIVLVCCVVTILFSCFFKQYENAYAFSKFTSFSFAAWLR